MKVKVRGATEVDIKKLKINRGDVVVVMRPKYMNQDKWDEVLTALATDIANYLGFNVMTIGCDRKWNEITKLSPEQMALYNWVPREDVLLSKGDSPEKILEVFELLQLDALLAARNEEEE